MSLLDRLLSLSQENGKAVNDYTGETGDSRVLFSHEFEKIGHVVVRERYYMGEYVRMLEVEGAQESACYPEEGRHFDLVFGYTKAFDLAYHHAPEESDTLLIGGGGFSYPKYAMSHFPKRRMDVSELYWEIVDLAKKYFFLDELYEKHDVRKSGRLHVYAGNGLTRLKKTEKLYDVIINDAFRGNNPDLTFVMPDTVELIKSRLKPDGVYAINVLTAMSGLAASSGKLVRATLQESFAHVKMIRVYPETDAYLQQNCLFLASDADLT